MTNMELFIVLTSIGSPVVVGLFIWFGVRSQIKANENNILIQIKEELEKERELLEDKIRKEREDRWWNLKFDFFLDLNGILEEISNFEHVGKKIKAKIDVLNRILNFQYRQHPVFKDLSLEVAIAELNESPFFDITDTESVLLTGDDLVELEKRVIKCLDIMKLHLESN